MEKPRVLVLFIVLLLLWGCADNAAPGGETSATSKTIYEIEGRRCVYPPEEMRLLSPNIMGFQFTPSKRSVYYFLYAPESYVSAEVVSDYYTNLDEITIEPTEMAMVTFIKAYNIPKKAMEEVVQSLIDSCLEEGFGGRDFLNEAYEIPNLDIIYTFDNRIIDAYYRRDNPVMPEWMKVNAPR